MTQSSAEREDAGSGRAGYAVKLVRGPFLELQPHPGHTENPDILAQLCRKLREAAPDRPIAADLFSGAGGLSLGLKQAGIEVVLAIDHDIDALRTHSHHFPGISADWDLGQVTNVERVADLMKQCGIDMLVGGPPCQPFSKAGRSGIRYRVRDGQRDAHDQRRDLWQSFLEVVRLAHPSAVIMENVPDMALDTDMFILRAMVEDLERFGYAVEERVVDTWRYGVPQFRQRLILVALAGKLQFDWPREVPERVNVWNAIGDLPEVEGGWRPSGGAEGWTVYDGPTTAFQRAMRAGVPEDQRGRVYDHITRPVRADDAVAFELMDTTTRYSDLPDEVKRYRDDIFDDKYKRLDEDDLSRTITAHIAKDGYWYIHPRQSRTLTVREAARLQTFPDWYRFNGPPSAAFRQIGNAVPPALGSELATAVRSSMSVRRSAGPSSREFADKIAGWFEAREELRLPWLRSPTRWQVIMASTILDRLGAGESRKVWTVLRRWPTPADALMNARLLEQIGTLTARKKRVDAILAMAAQMPKDAESLTASELSSRVTGLQSSVAELAILVAPGEADGEEPVGAGQGVLRVAARVNGDVVDRRNRLTDGRLAVARMIGGGTSSRSAQLGLIELAADICRPSRPLCGQCPLRSWCRSADNAEARPVDD